MNEYLIFENEKTVGRGCLERQGMYYLFRCQVFPSRKGRWKLWLNGRPLCLLVPDERGYTATARIPARELSVNACHFIVKRESEALKLEISDPMKHLQVRLLPYARLVTDAGKHYLVIRGDQDSSKPTGQ